jgi:hypothetical protein
VQPSKVGKLLASDAGLQPVIAKARAIGTLSKLCFDFLPPGLARLVRAVTLKDRQLVLLAASPAAAAKLKLLCETLYLHLLEQGAQVNAVSVRVQPDIGYIRPPVEKRTTRLSQGALAALQSLYQTMPESAARAALKALLDHQLKQ